MEEGLYRVDYRGAVGLGSATMVMRNGKVLGTDVAGALYEGTYDFDPQSQLNSIGVLMKLPPNAELVTGLNAGPTGAAIPIVAAFRRPSPTSRSVVSVAGRSVEIEVTYVGPLPS